VLASAGPDSGVLASAGPDSGVLASAGPNSGVLASACFRRMWLAGPGSVQFRYRGGVS
jgi:hypothetical protein